jgi:hypothetical protein
MIRLPVMPFFPLGSNILASVCVALQVIPTKRGESRNEPITHPCGLVAFRVLEYEPMKRCTNTEKPFGATSDLVLSLALEAICHPVAYRLVLKSGGRPNSLLIKEPVEARQARCRVVRSYPPLLQTVIAKVVPKRKSGHYLLNSRT